jgi:methyl-accepting chemotaxis protein WspA
MFQLNRVKLSIKLVALSTVAVVGLLVFAAVAYATLDTVKVSGPVYDQIVADKDLLADMLPPPLYIVESDLLVYEMLGSDDKAELNRLVAKSRALRRGYEQRHEYWKLHLSGAAIRDVMLERAHRPALEFFELRDREFIPAVTTGSRERAQALAHGPLKELYTEHRRMIDEAVTLAQQSSSDREQQALALVSRRTAALFVVAAVVTGLVLWLALLISRNVTRRIALGVKAAEKVASGDLTDAIVVDGDDETGALLASLKKMNHSLSSLISRVKDSSVSLMSTATQISATSKQQETTVNNFSASTSEIAAAVREISATSNELKSTLDGITEAAGRSASLAESGREGLDEMDSTMRQLSSSTGSISSKLSVIREKAHDINMVVTTITKVADQTNLLSVNAAIEAEKAGEYGLGFLVVAREIRRLADQSAVATLDIEQMVRQMQASVSAGVMEMDKFAEEVRRGVATVGDIGRQLAQIIEQVQSLSTQIEAVSEGMSTQAQGAAQISDAMSHLTEGARQTAASLKEFNGATHSLRDAVTGLKQEISYFNTAG